MISEGCVKSPPRCIYTGMNDYYKSIEGFPGYRISRRGHVESCWVRRGRYRLPTETWLPLMPIYRDGYCTVNLPAPGGQKAIRRIHRLVLEAFVGPGPAGKIACHRDGDRLNNDILNLYWGTHQTNSDDAVKHGTKARGEALKAKLTEADVIEIRRLRADGARVVQLAARFHVSESNIRSVVHGRTWGHVLPLDEQPAPQVEGEGLRGAA
ncbi:HNH endonuclease [Tundrisphaera sp. TA3]|uniref:HNH endonuclease n=1 Tax=Tundrisphaera sp. TA3 TaxID=3435775 RepID=UPI003EBF83A8